MAQMSRMSFLYLPYFIIVMIWSDLHLITNQFCVPFHRYLRLFFPTILNTTKNSKLLQTGYLKYLTTKHGTVRLDRTFILVCNHSQNSKIQ